MAWHAKTLSQGLGRLRCLSQPPDHRVVIAMLLSDYPLRPSHLLKIGCAFLIGAIASTSGLIAKPKNVLFIITDDLNCNIGAYGHPLVQTPHLDQLAQEGLLFQNAYTNYPSCGQSRASFMTGLYPEQNGVTQLRRLFRDHVPDAVTMSQHFQRQGYTAVRVGKIYHYDVPFGIGSNGHDDPASWDVRVSPLVRDRIEEDKVFSVTPGKFGASLSWHEAEGDDEEQTDGMVATESIRALEHFSDSGEPFFLGVGFYRSHTPFVAPKKYFDLYNPTEIEVPRVPTGIDGVGCIGITRRHGGFIHLRPWLPHGRARVLPKRYVVRGFGSRASDPIGAGYVDPGSNDRSHSGDDRFLQNAQRSGRYARSGAFRVR
ncbi:MAG: sulfatase-like hydrolase/transferase [Opitutaceae bacterium]|nr:sulfatase-like hydrolase/transferase [Opitutaceae bacterium]